MDGLMIDGTDLLEDYDMTSKASQFEQLQHPKPNILILPGWMAVWITQSKMDMYAINLELW